MKIEQVLEGKNIIVIDSDKLVHRAMKMIFSKKSMQSFHCSNRIDALSQLHQRKIDAVILDSDISDDPYTLCTQIRRSYPYVAILFTAASRDEERQLNAFAAGADDFISKPPITRILLQRLSHAISRRKAEQQSVFLRSRLEQYIPVSALNEVINNVGVQKLEATLLFSDMRGFTAATFDHDMNLVFQGINRAMSIQSEIIQKNGGYVDGFSGDGMLAVFDGAANSHKACKAAAEIIQVARKTKTSIWDPIPLGIGINYGEIIRGDLGSKERKANTVIGTPVNISARLCGVAKAMQCICSQRIFDRIGEDFQFELAGTVSLKGLPHPMKAYSLVVA